MGKRRQFCELGPACYAIALKKETLRRHLKDLTGREHFAKTRQDERLGHLVFAHSNHLIKRGKGIDVRLQENKAVNIDLACGKLNGILIRPGETFSFWRTVGNATRRKGYLEGRVIRKDGLHPGVGGGLCNLANTIHYLVLHSPLTVTEFHHHSDALAPDEGGRRPMSAGTSVSYNSVDFRFCNTTDQTFQLLVWCEDGQLKGQLRSQRDVPARYALEEEDHHFRREGEKYYRVSRIYKTTLDKDSGALLDKTLIWDNHSEVMFDPSLIPPDQLRAD